MSFKDAVNKSVKRWFLNKDGEISFTKVGVEVAAVGGAVVTLPASLAAVGLTVAIPPVVILGAKLAVFFGSMMAGTGARDAMDKSKTDHITVK